PPAPRPRRTAPRPARRPPPRYPPRPAGPGGNEVRVSDFPPPAPPVPDPSGEPGIPGPLPLPASLRPRWGMHLGLLISTLITATLAGSWFWEGQLGGGGGRLAAFAPSRLAAGLPHPLVPLPLPIALGPGPYIAR